MCHSNNAFYPTSDCRTKSFLYSAHNAMTGLLLFEELWHVATHSVLSLEARINSRMWRHIFTAHLLFQQHFAETEGNVSMLPISFFSIQENHTDTELIKFILLICPTGDDWMKENKKLKFTLVQALRFCTGSTAHRGSRDIAVLYRHWGSVQAVRPIGGVEV